LAETTPWWNRERHADRRPILLARNKIEAEVRAYLAGNDFLMVDPPGLQRFKAGANSDSLAENLAGHGWSFFVQRIHDSKFQAVNPKLISEIVVKLFLGDRGLRDTKAPESPGRHQMSVHRPGQRAIVRDVVGPRGMDRNARRDGRSPGRVGAGVEVGGEVHGFQLAIAGRARAQADV